MIYAKEPPKKIAGRRQHHERCSFVIPPGADNHEVSGSRDARRRTRC